MFDQVHQIGTDPHLIAEKTRRVRFQSEDSTKQLTEERSSLQYQLRTHHADLQATASLPSSTKGVSQLADLQERISITERRLTKIDYETAVNQAEQTFSGEAPDNRV